MAAKPHGRARSHDAHEEEEHENHERWLVSYADMVTLLFVLFVVLFAISQIDKVKFAQLASGLATSFGAPAFLPSNPSILNAQGPGNPNTMMFPAINFQQTQQTQQITDPAIRSAVQQALAAADAARRAQAVNDARNEVDKLAQVKAAINTRLAKAGITNSVYFRVTERGLVVSVLSDNVVFGSDSAALTQQGRRIVDALAPVLAALPNDIAVEGHTNTVPQRPANFIDEWQLSSERAGNVLRRLEADYIAPDRMSVGGYGDTRPLLPRSDPRADKINKRVELVVLSSLSAETRSWLPVLADSKTGLNTMPSSAPSFSSAAGQNPGGSR